MNIGHIAILHNESKNLKDYKGVEARIGNYYPNGRDFRKVFNTGDISSDYVAALTLLITKDTDCVMRCSSCEHFAMDVKGFEWIHNEIVGDVIRKSSDKGDWLRVNRQHGKSKGRDMWIQGESKTHKGNFIVMDNKNGIFVMYPDGLDETTKFKTAQEAMQFCNKAKRQTITTWE